MITGPAWPICIPVPTTAISPEELALKTIGQLPPFSPVLTKLMGSLSNDDVSFGELGDLVEKDAVLAGNVLRLVNSAYYARRGTISSVRHAVSLLGLSKLRNIGMSLSVARMWNNQKWAPGWIPSQFNIHGVAAAIMTDLLATVIPGAEFPEGAFTAGLLQNCGMLLIAMGLPHEFAAIRTMHIETGRPLELYEAEIVGTTHAELSAITCREWGLPAPIVAAVRSHHGAGLTRGSLGQLVQHASTVTGQLGIEVQEWCHRQEGDPEETIRSAGVPDGSDAILTGFQNEFDAVCGFFN